MPGPEDYVGSFWTCSCFFPQHAALHFKGNVETWPSFTSFCPPPLMGRSVYSHWENRIMHIKMIASIIKCKLGNSWEESSIFCCHLFTLLLFSSLLVFPGSLRASVLVTRPFSVLHVGLVPLRLQSSGLAVLSPLPFSFCGFYENYSDIWIASLRMNFRYCFGLTSFEIFSLSVFLSLAMLAWVSLSLSFWGLLSLESIGFCLSPNLRII